MATKHEIEQLLRRATKELRDVDVGHSIQRLHISQLGGPLPHALGFATQFVARNKPCIIEGALDAWPALQKWDEQYITDKAASSQITVDFSPHGRSDAVVNIDLTKGELAEPNAAESSTQKCFVTPCERKMEVRQFFKLLRASRQNGVDLVPYIQHQNSSLSEEFQCLQEDTQPHLDWADQVFGGPPEATNLWIGDERSVTSFHKDHYENMYGVIRGTKIFHLLPPTDLWRLYFRSYPAAQWESSEEPFSCTDAHDSHVLQELGMGRLRAQVQPESTVTWTEVDAEPDDPAQAAQDFPLFFDEDLPQPLVAEVGPGDVLYLPACWYHRVSQRCSQREEGHDYVMAVNFWYDMAFSHSPYVSKMVVEDLTQLLHKS